MSNSQQVERDLASVDMMELLRGIWGRKLLILLVTLLLGGAASFFILREKPSYTVEGQVLVDNLETPFSPAAPGEGPETRAPFDDRDILSQVSVLSSRDLGDRVINELGLAGKGEFDPAVNGIGKLGQVLIALGFKDNPLTKSLEERAFDRYRSALTVFQIPDSKVITVRYYALDPEIAADVANKLTELYVTSTITARPGFARIIQRAVAPANPSYPKTGPTIVLATLAGLTLGLGLAFLAEVLRMAGGRAATPSVTPEPELRALPILPAPVIDTIVPRESIQPLRRPPQDIGPVPPGSQQVLIEIPETSDLVTAADRANQPLHCPSADYAVAAGRMVSWLNGIRQSLGVQKLAVLTIGEAGPDGATAAVAIARIIAAQGIGALVIDADDARSCVHSICGIEPGAGLSNILMDEATIDAAVQRDAGSLAHVLRSGTKHGDLASLVATPRFEALIDAFAQVYPAIIIHCGRNTSQPVIRKCHAALLMAPGTRVLDAARMIESWRQSGLRAVQFVRIGLPVRRAA
jgi:capsular polysaccharide biosynthesis protein